jgi:hypothetical protein
MKKLLTVLLLSISLLSCKKESDNGLEPSKLSPEMHLLSGGSSKDWIMTSYKISANEFRESIENCDKDDIFTFKSDSTFIVNAGSVKCDPSEMQIENGKWHIKNKTTFVATSAQGQTVESTLDELSSTGFKATTEIKYPNGYTSTQISTYKAK